MGSTKNDLAMHHFLSPLIGRVATSSAYSTNQLLRFSIQNRSITPITNFSISYQVDNASWQSTSYQQTILAGDTMLISLPVSGLQSIGNHTLRLALRNISAIDAVPNNDSLTIVLRQVPNNPITVPFKDDFETTTNFRLTGSQYALSSNERFDFETTNEVGQLSSYINDSLTIAGSRSLHLDAHHSINALVKNTLQATFNCTTFSNQEYRFDFDYYTPVKISSKNK